MALLLVERSSCSLTQGLDSVHSALDSLRARMDQAIDGKNSHLIYSTQHEDQTVVICISRRFLLLEL
jgi:hypothetical protein